MRVAVLTMQKDEGRLLESWIAYHGQLFGTDGLHIVDNGSTDPYTLDVLGNAARAGAKIFHNPSPRDFERKGEIISRIIAERCRRFDICFPLDADEFLVRFDDRQPTSDKAAIEAELQEFLDSGKQVSRLLAAIWNEPGSTFGHHAHQYKVGLRSDFPVKLDLGLHLYDHANRRDLVDAELIHRGRLGIMHFHNRPFADTLGRARLKLAQRVRDFEPATLRDYNGAGGHLIKYFFMTPQEYYAQFSKHEVDLAPLFAPYGLEVPFSRLPDEDASTLSAAIAAKPKAKGKPAPNTAPGLTAAELELFLSALRVATNVLEFGMGGKTILARGVVRGSLVAAHSDPAMIEKVRGEIGAGPGSFELLHADIGPVGAWGFPTSKQQNHLDNYHLGLANRITPDVDFFLIDGRFRVACAAMVAGAMAADAVVAIHNYRPRPHYHVVETVLRPIAETGELTLFVRRRDVDADTIAALFADHRADPR
ncbi:glycosyltransferase family 2 protein [Oharaeibacter diazotrophicus]|uniref:Glycosyltransferase involved in cell wall biosynthesis n=1 Tax=Oharaeibacter diazotrophicus TaxID=1920512 RepID=A0A4R6RL06_9HYPH|nr:glycosyltransferase family 2 protein [Oharaeibacter diazotrophicus]TDP86647.1 glycosyltransferase involved in cell wall biosynthesis [Oharaeibacter diazotrophicus]BBE71412.1 hypothetical protein OHA_1_00986 [Pleomorphomonas sp. SM30]GLS78169.1 hypothetical protein GCM10007904_35060 [Oharaeibacter diazotrophicus]